MPDLTGQAPDFLTVSGTQYASKHWVLDTIDDLSNQLAEQTAQVERMIATEQTAGRAVPRIYEASLSRKNGGQELLRNLRGIVNSIMKDPA